MGKTARRMSVDYTPSKKEMLQNEDRLVLKHKKRFVDESIEDDDDNFKMFGDDESLDEDLMEKYMRH